VYPVGFNSSDLTWPELERTLSGRPARHDQQHGDGNDAPAWTRHRDGYAPPPDLDERHIHDHPGPRVPYAELHAHSNFSFLDGASHPEELVEQAARLDLDALALTDHDGMYGAVRLADAARELGVRTVLGTELSLGLPGPQNGVPDPAGEHLLLLARGVEGYRRLCRAVTSGHLAGHTDPTGHTAEKGRPIYQLDEIAATVRGQCVVLTGCRKGTVRRALTALGPDAAVSEVDRLIGLFGRDNVVVELINHGLPTDSTTNDILTAIAQHRDLPTIATNVVHYTHPTRGRLAAALAAVRARRSLDEMAGWLPPAPSAFLRSGAEQQARFARYPGAVTRAAQLGVELAFDLHLIAPNLPPFPVPAGHDETSWLRHLTYQGAADRYGPVEAHRDAYAQIEHELAVIEQLGFPGYFLIVWDLVRFARASGILCQGRGSAANSAVCYALGITNADPVRWKLLFERFLAPERDGHPDIDLDIESDRREEVIQYVYRTYRRWQAAQVANVITYRGKSAVRDMATALGYSTGHQDAWSRHIDHGGSVTTADSEPEHDIPPLVLDLASQVEGFPRHLGIHSGGMVLCDRPVSEVVPVEWARMAGRSVVQWDKDDCASAGLVKFDLLGLGMLSALHYAIDLVADHEGVTVDVAALDLEDDEVYAMLRRADSVGVFQVESRAQMATLPRLKPREFYDLVVEVALIRPGPIQGGSVHPYIRRRNGLEPADCGHPLLERALGKTLGVPLFQEQLMQMAIDVADFTPAEADQLRRAMGAKRSTTKMARLQERLFTGMAAHGITGQLADTIYQRLLAFANYGFPESHALSFAHLVFASAWFKRYHPAAFCAALLRAQPMGFYSPQSLVADARRHGVIVRGPDINASTTDTTLEPTDTTTPAPAVRLGLGGIRHISTALADTIVTDRRTHGSYQDMTDLARRVTLTAAQMEALATAGAFDSVGLRRREALWAAGAAATDRPDRLPGTVLGTHAPALPGMTALELAAADVWATGISPTTYPIQFVRDHLTQLGALPAAALAGVPPGTRVLVGGAVTHRQRPATARGVTFLNLEDETGMINVICSAGLWTRYRRIARTSTAMIVRGIIESADGVVSLTADQLQPLNLRIPLQSRDFR
jgi:error-prone DNA polymerase